MGGLIDANHKTTIEDSREDTNLRGDSIQVLHRPIIRFRAKRIKEANNGLIQELRTRTISWRPKNQDPQ